jgi:hypothetical protein
MGSDLLAVICNEHIGSPYEQKRIQYGQSPILKISFNRVSTEYQWGINNLWCCIMNNPRAVL